MPLDFVEWGLRAAVQRDAAAMLGHLLGERLWSGEPAARTGEKCYHGRAKTIETLFGPVELRRDYLYDRETGEGRTPLDERLGLLEGYSPGLAKIMGRVGAQQSYEAGAADLLAYAGVAVEARAIARMVDRLGPQMAQARAAHKPAASSAPVPVMYVEADGTGVPMRKAEVAGRKGKAADGSAQTREVKLGCVFTQHVTDQEGQPLRDHASTTYVATFAPSDDFGLLLRQEALRRGLGLAAQVVFLGDGAAWVWELARVNFPQATCILDFYHAAEHLGALVDVLQGKGSKRARRQRDQWTALMKAGGIEKILARARSALRKQPLPCPEAAKEIAYFEKNTARMAYGSFRTQGYFIGSGVVEAGCRTVVGQRLKHSGMFWSTGGAQNVLTLRTALLGNHFDTDWIHRSPLVA